MTIKKIINTAKVPIKYGQMTLKILPWSKLKFWQMRCQLRPICR